MSALLEQAASRRLTDKKDPTGMSRPSSPTINLFGSDSGHDQRALKRLNTSGMTRTGSGDGVSCNVKAEIFFIVRPPPTHLGHRLNLQIQLINTSGGGVTSGSGRTRYTNGLPGGHSSGDVSRNTAGTGNSLFAVAEASVAGVEHQDSAKNSPLTTPIARCSAVGSPAGTPVDENVPLYNQSELSRTLSSRSNRSVTSLASSSASGTRRMLPCYNLEFHALQPTVVTDAGTDAKIAKIHKRGVEMLDLAMLDPVVYGEHTSLPSLAEREAIRKQTEASRRAGQANGLVEMKDFKPNNILNKLKRMSFRGGTSNSLPASTPASTSNKVSNSTSRPSSETRRPSSFFGASTSSSTPLAPVSIPAVPLFRDGDGHNTTVIGTGINSKDRATTPAGSSLDGTVLAKHAPGYVWVVRQLLRRDLVAEANHVADITLEWRKRKRRTAGQSAGLLLSARSRDSNVHDPPASRRASRDEPEALRASSSTRNSRSFDAAIPTSTILGRSESRRSHVPSSPTRSSAVDLLSPNRLGKARSGGSSRSADHANPVEMVSPNRDSRASTTSLGGDHALDDGDSGDESDPEDSETPWTCDLVIMRRQSASMPNDRQRYFLGSLTPAPHHPKLIAHLAVPVSLSPISIANSLSPNSRQVLANHLTLSIEELKDVMAVTGLWLVVRENLGLSGIAKSRKNDGSWRLATPAALKN